MDKYQMLDALILLVDKLADARGAERCMLLIDMLKRLGALKEGLQGEDKAHEAEKDLLKAQIKDLTTPPPLRDGEIREGGQTYTINLAGPCEEE